MTLYTDGHESFIRRSNSFATAEQTRAACPSSALVQFVHYLVSDSGRPTAYGAF